MSKYAYEITHKNGLQEWIFQNFGFTEDEILKAMKESPYEEYHDVVKVKFHTKVPNGYHLCGCGNLVKGTDEHELCDECKEIYGHDYDYEL